MATRHAPGFLKLVEAARKDVREVTIEDYRRSAAAGEPVTLIDVREDHEWAAGHLPGAIHMSKGIIERDVEERIPDPDTPIVCQCGGGFRSVLVCENLKKMGYTNVSSLAEGYRGWVSRKLPIETDKP